MCTHARPQLQGGSSSSSSSSGSGSGSGKHGATSSDGGASLLQDCLFDECGMCEGGVCTLRKTATLVLAEFRKSADEAGRDINDVIKAMESQSVNGAQVREVVEHLAGEGHLDSTIDELHFKCHKKKGGSGKQKAKSSEASSSSKGGRSSEMSADGTEMLVEQNAILRWQFYLDTSEASKHIDEHALSRLTGGERFGETSFPLERMLLLLYPSVETQLTRVLLPYTRLLRTASSCASQGMGPNKVTAGSTVDFLHNGKTRRGHVLQVRRNATTQNEKIDILTDNNGEDRAGGAGGRKGHTDHPEEGIEGAAERRGGRARGGGERRRSAEVRVGRAEE